MSYGVSIEVWGEYALFTRPEYKAERVSFEVLSPSAARGILEAIFWHPGMTWIIDCIYVLKPIQFAAVKKNEVRSKINARTVSAAIKKEQGSLYLAASEDRQQRAAVMLKDVHYVIKAHFELTDKANPSDNHGKFSDIIKRRLRRGQCFHQPYFGLREFPAHFREWGSTEIQTAYPNETRDLGYMLYDMDYSDPMHIKPIFFHAVLKNGVLDLRDCEVQR